MSRTMVREAEACRRVAKDLLDGRNVPGGPDGFVAEVVAPVGVHICMEVIAIVAVPVLVVVGVGSLLAKGAEKLFDAFS
jgi:hypothetical protein